MDANSWKLKLIGKSLGGHGKKWVWPMWKQDCRTGSISRTNQENSGKLKRTFNNFWVGVVKIWCDLWGHGTLESAVSRMNW